MNFTGQLVDIPTLNFNNYAKVTLENIATGQTSVQYTDSNTGQISKMVDPGMYRLQVEQVDRAKYVDTLNILGDTLETVLMFKNYTVQSPWHADSSGLRHFEMMTSTLPTDPDQNIEAWGLPKRSWHHHHDDADPLSAPNDTYERILDRVESYISEVTNNTITYRVEESDTTLHRGIRHDYPSQSPGGLGDTEIYVSGGRPVGATITIWNAIPDTNILHEVYLREKGRENTMVSRGRDPTYALRADDVSGYAANYHADEVEVLKRLGAMWLASILTM